VKHFFCAALWVEKTAGKAAQLRPWKPLNVDKCAYLAEIPGKKFCHLEKT